MSSLIRTILLALAASQAVHAGIVAPRAPTPYAKLRPDPVNGWSPNPTRGPELVFGSMNNNQLFGRDNTQLTDVHVCGWVSGLSQSPLSCPNNGNTGSACGYLTQSGEPYNVWCCPYTQSSDGTAYADFDGCPWITLCLPYTDANNQNTGSQIIRDTSSHVISCPEQAPECTTIVLQGPPSSIYFQYGCGAVSSTYSAFQSYTVEADRTTSSPSSSTTASTSTGTSTMTSATASSTDSSSSTDVGAIAGGTIGGVAALAIIGGVIAWLIYRKKAARRPAMREVSQYTGSTYQPSTMGGSTWGGTDNQSVAPSARK